MRFRRFVIITVFVLGCGKTLKRQPPVPVATVVDMARERPMPEQVRTRFNIKLRSAERAGSTGGGLVLARPGKGRLDVFGPLGGSVMVLASNGEGLSALLMRDKRHVHADQAEHAVREVTGGAAGIDDLLGILQGDMPFDDAEVQSIVRSEVGSEVVLQGPNGTMVHAVLDNVTATPLSLEALDADGLVLLSAEYGEFEPFEDDPSMLLPSSVALYVPALELSVTLKYKTWKRLDDIPDVFSPEVPEDFTSAPLETAAWTN